METRAVREPSVDRGRCVVQAPSGERREPHRERPHIANGFGSRRCRDECARPFETQPAIEPYVARAVNQDVGDSWHFPEKAEPIWEPFWAR